MKNLMTSCLVLFILFSSCTFNNEITTYNELAENIFDGNLQIVTVDSILFLTDSYSYNDSSISIVCKMRQNNKDSIYKRDLLYKDIAYIQTKETYIWPTLAYVGMNVFLVGNGLSMISSNTGIDPIIKIVYPSGGGGSCPYIYSWDGENYILEGEAFGSALGKALETSSSIVFEKLRAEDNKLKIRITNERPETHFINKVKFAAVETDENILVFSDNYNKFYAVNEQKQIMEARDKSDKDISNYLKLDDNNYWKSDLSTAVQKYDFEDQLFVTLKTSSISDSISLIVSAINTEISNTVFNYLQTILGNEFVNFTKALERDEEIINIMKETLKRSSLKIDMWDGKKWKFIDLIYPEANRVEFKKLVRLPNLSNEFNDVHLRLRALCDVWEIDAIQYDDTQQKDCKIHNPNLINYSDNQQNDFTNLMKKDGNYIKLLPGQIMELVYEDVKVQEHKKLSYAITVDGYLYEWVIDKGNGSLNEFANLEINTPKVKLVKSLMSNMELLLPIIYDNWKETKKRYAVD